MEEAASQLHKKGAAMDMQTYAECSHKAVDSSCFHVGCSRCLHTGGPLGSSEWQQRAGGALFRSQRETRLSPSNSRYRRRIYHNTRLQYSTAFACRPAIPGFEKVNREGKKRL
eukprot:1158571-Pelagomonas_calceolata.AAC.7